MRRTRKLSVKIPPGVDHGQPIRLTGEGDAGAGGGAAGSLYVVITVRPHQYFKRDEDDILYELRLNMAQAALGTEVTVPTVDGDTPLSVPPGTQNDKVFTIKGKGVPHLRGGGRGDQYVRTTVVIPTELTREQKRLLEELSATLGAPGHPEDDDDHEHKEKGFFDRIREKFAG